MNGAIVRTMGKLLGGVLLLGLAMPGRAATVEYIHTDALGSPVAVTDSNGVVIERREYEPYGRQLAPTAVADGPGYTGHVSDAATGLDYMQQRYYDPGIGRFLSVDPITATSGTGANFNRYWYANNNPFRFLDLDGRIAGECAGSRIAASCSGGTAAAALASTARKPKSSATDKQREMVRIVSDDHSTPDEAADQFGKDTQEEAGETKREPQAGIVRTGDGTYGYTEPMWGPPNGRVVDVKDYISALLAVYGGDAIAFAHGHWDQNNIFSPVDVRPFFGKGSVLLYMHNQRGETRKLNSEILRKEIRAAGAKDLRDYLRSNQGVNGVCIGGCP